MNNMFTIKEALERASLLLLDSGIAKPRLEAQLLLSACSSLPLAYIYAHPGEILQSAAQKMYWDWVQRRAAGEPFAYITGEKEFMGLYMRVSPAVLIPRPETEILVEALAAYLSAEGEPLVLEIGTGSGAIAIALAVSLPRARLRACDISAAALAVAGENARRHGVQNRIDFAQGDLYAPAAGETCRFSAVVSNPPYIASDEMALLDAGVRCYEPELALDGGPGGLTFYRRLTEELTVLKQPPGLLAFEVGAGQAAAVAGLCDAAGYGRIRIVRDLAGIERVVLANPVHGPLT